MSVSFGGLQALDGVSIEIPHGAIAGLLGPNGAGKSTLFGVISGLRRPDGGTVLLDGRDITTASPQFRARMGLARTFQRPELFGELTVREHLILARRVRRGGTPVWRDLLGLRARGDDAEDEEIDRLLAMLNLEGVAHSPATFIGLGTARLVEVARALATTPRVLLLDEPSSGLDASETDELVNVLGRLRSDSGVTLLLVEHDVGMVLSLADTVTVLDFGRVIAAGTAAEIRSDAGVQQAYLGTTA